MYYFKQLTLSKFFSVSVLLSFLWQLTKGWRTNRNNLKNHESKETYVGVEAGEAGVFPV